MWMVRADRRVWRFSCFLDWANKGFVFPFWMVSYVVRQSAICVLMGMS